jgi:hypothetical protein
MRHACLRAMASIICWPTTFGTEQILCELTYTIATTFLFLALNTSPRLHHGQQNLLEPGACYLDVRSRFIKNLVHTLRNETDSMNLQLALGKFLFKTYPAISNCFSSKLPIMRRMHAL